MVHQETIMVYYIEKLKAIEDKSWQDSNVDTFTWVQASDQYFESITQARDFIDSNCDSRLSYRITNGEQVWTI